MRTKQIQFPFLNKTFNFVSDFNTRIVLFYWMWLGMFAIILLNKFPFPCMPTSLSNLVTFYETSTSLWDYYYIVVDTAELLYLFVYLYMVYLSVYINVYIHVSIFCKHNLFLIQQVQTATTIYVYH